MNFLMKSIKILLSSLLLFSFIVTFGQQKENAKKIKITGKVIDKTTNQPLEYAIIALFNTKTNKTVSGGITNDKGEFSIETNAGIYDVKIEFISFKPIELLQQNLFQDTNLNTVSLTSDATQLDQVDVKQEKSSVEIKLDKRIYNVGKDMTVKGGTASDVLNNVPSVTVDSDGNVSLRGSENVKILIDGKPSNSSNIANALQNIAADAVEKVEVITNPSARYDAEGGSGILNIVLKKGKNNGLNGSFTGTIGYTKNNNLNANANYKNEFFNFFATVGIADTYSPGNGLTNADYLNTDGTIDKTINERNKRNRYRKGFNYNFGIDLFVTKSLTWTNSMGYRKSDGDNDEEAFLYNYLSTKNYTQTRFNDQFTTTRDVDFTTNITQKFKKEGHKLTINYSYSREDDKDSSIISDYIIGQEDNLNKQASKNFQKPIKNSFQADYVLPIQKDGQFEAGFKSDSNDLLTDYNVANLANGVFINNPLQTNQLNYKEKIKAIYSQYGSKYKKLSYLFGLRYEDTNLDINLLTTQDFRNKKYHNYFPSAFLTYELTEKTSLSLNYSRRIMRPRSRFINPFAGYTSNVNLFQGNPNINPSLTHAVDLSLLTKFNKTTLTTSVYYNKTKDPFQFTRRFNGDTVTTIVNGITTVTQVVVSTPINLISDDRFGFEFTLNFSPFKWWKLNSNFNFFQSSIKGNNSYTLVNSNQVFNENLDKNSLGWFTKLNSKITMPYKIDWQTNVNYTAPQNTAQGKSIGVAFVNLAFSKDFFKDKGTLSLNVNDLLNSNKMIRQFNLPTLNSYSEMQRRERQINLSFTYRFNKKKTERERPKMDGGEGGDF
jgi:outer membrane receptor for ferrienterochelin and colicins